MRDCDPDAILAAAKAFERIGAMLSAADADRLAVACGGIHTPALDLAANPLPLTVREREIAMLVAAGLSNRDIAERLTLSIRTVESHVYRAYFKLGISDREALGAVLRGEEAAAPPST